MLCYGRTLMDQNTNVNLNVVQGDFPIKYRPKTLKTPMVNLFKNLRLFQNYILKIQWEIHFLTYSNTDQNAPKKI